MTILGVTSGTGQVRVVSTGPCGLMLRWLNRIPGRGDRVPVRLEVTNHPGAEDHEEVWTRRFGVGGRITPPPLRSRFRNGGDGTLRERWGPVEFVFDPARCGEATTLELRHSRVGPWRVPGRWVSIRARITTTAPGCSRTTVQIAVLGGRAATLCYTAELAPEATP